MRRRLNLIVAVMALISTALPASAGGSPFPEVIPLPDGIGPEGIASGSGSEFFTGSLASGAIYKGDLRTGTGDFINEPADFGTPRAALGMKHDPRSDVLWVSGGPTGQAYVYDADSGETLAEIPLASAPPTFVNDVVVTRSAAYFTDSFQPVIYRVPVDERGLPTGPAVTLPLSGDFVFVPNSFNGNGVDATPNSKTLILVNSATGSLYTVDPGTGAATSIDLGTGSVPSGDGILLDGKTLYVVQNFLNQIAVVHLSPDLSSGVVAAPITSPEFMIPTTVAEFGNTLYAVNARFDVAPGPMVEYDVVAVPKS